MLHHVVAQAPVAFKLVFGEELVGGGFVGKRGMGGAVLRDADVFIPGNGGFQIDEIADAAVAVGDLADGAMCEALTVFLPADGADVDIDFGVEIGKGMRAPGGWSLGHGVEA